jgi:acetyl esterase
MPSEGTDDDFESQVAEFLERVRSVQAPSYKLGVEAARKSSRECESAYEWTSTPGVDVSDRTIPVKGGSIPIRVYRPASARADENLPVLMYIHGGGWVVGWVDSLDLDSVCRYISAGADCVVVSVGYRLAPEHKFPIPVEDSYAALQWIAYHASELRIDADRLAVAGESAGGNLTAAVSLIARDRDGPSIIFQIPVAPVIRSYFETKSYEGYGKGYGLDTEEMMWYWDQYVKNDADRTNPYAAPLSASDLSRLPPALVMTAEFDPLRDEGEEFGEKLRDAGVPVKILRAEGNVHGFLALPFGEEQRRILVEELRGAFAKESP